MGRRPLFDKDHILAAALEVLAEHGPGAVTIQAVAQKSGAPTGSIYHRFDSRNVMLAGLWLRVVENFQKGFITAIDKDDGLSAALHTPRWVRKHLMEGRILLLYRREQLIKGAWPNDVKDRIESLAREINQAIHGFTQRNFDESNSQSLERTVFTLIDVPRAAVMRYLELGIIPSPSVDQLIRETYYTIFGRE